MRAPSATLDCDDADPARNPSADEVCATPQVDDDCDGAIDADDESTVDLVDAWTDADGDGFGVDGNPRKVCAYALGSGLAAVPDDCDDSDAQVNPGAQEVCDDGLVDEDCDDAIDDEDVDVEGQVEQFSDFDGDGDADSPLGAWCVEVGSAEGTDCDDDDDTLYPDAPEVAWDGIDQNCDGMHNSEIHDDFETGGVDPLVWSVVEPGHVVLLDPVTGTRSLVVEAGSAYATVAVDASACGSMGWSYEGRRGGAPPLLTDSELRLDLWDGTSWRRVDTWWGVDDQDPVNVVRQGGVSDSWVSHSALQARLMIDGRYGAVLLDAITLSCLDEDADGDGLGAAADCDDADPAHQYDCATCVDLDGDGFGWACDAGWDCDDAAPTVHPGAPEVNGDGVDANCDGFDQIQIGDDFETLEDRSVWGVWTGEVDITGFLPSPDYRLLFHEDGWADTVPLDTSSCDEVQWGATVNHGGGSKSELVLGYDVGLGTVEVARIGNPVDSYTRFYSGVIPDGAAAAASMVFSFWSTASASMSDNDHLFDFFVECVAPDLDGDGHQGRFDCAEGDPDHWSDCGLCVDLDADTYGVGCDRGLDCDDGDPGSSPHVTDVFGDGIEPGCDGVDGPAQFDDFELGRLDPLVWEDPGMLAGGGIVWSLGVGGYVLEIRAGDEVTTLPLDTTSCSVMEWALSAYGDPFGSGDADLLLSWEDDLGVWQDIVRLDWSLEYEPRFGTVTDAAAMRDGVRFRLTSSDDNYRIDHISFTCIE